MTTKSWKWSCRSLAASRQGETASRRQYKEQTQTLPVKGRAQSARRRFEVEGIWRQCRPGRLKSLRVVAWQVWIIAAAAPCRSAQHTSSRAVAAVAAAIARAVVLCQGYASQKRMLSLPSISKGRTRRTSGSAPPLACILLPPLLRAVRRDRLLRRRRLGERQAPLPFRGQ
jgi:hypothetical protein